VLAGGISAAVIVPGGSAEPAPTPAVVANSLVELDPATGRVRSVTPVGDTPVSIALTPKAIWVVNRGDRTVSRVDARTHAVRTIGGAQFAFDIAADRRGNIWVSSYQNPIVTRISAGTGSFPNPPSAPETIRVPLHAGALAVGGGYLWVANAGAAIGDFRDTMLGAKQVSRIDLQSHRLVPPIRMSQFPRSIAFGSGAAWVGTIDSSFEQSAVSVVRTGSAAPETVDPGVGQPLQIAVGANGVWVLKFDGTLERIDPETRRVVARIPTGDELEVLSAAVGAGFVWITNRADSSVSKIDPRTNRVVRTIPLGRVGAVPCGVAADAHAVWVTIGPDTDCASPATR
jgi:YVTN family beta-propeller protein